jgi:hypothetical protein
MCTSLPPYKVVSLWRLEEILFIAVFSMFMLASGVEVPANVR